MQSCETGNWIESSRVCFRDDFNQYEYNWKSQHCCQQRSLWCALKMKGNEITQVKKSKSQRSLLAEKVVICQEGFFFSCRITHSFNDLQNLLQNYLGYCGVEHFPLNVVQFHCKSCSGIMSPFSIGKSSSQELPNREVCSSAVAHQRLHSSQMPSV